MRPRTIPVRVLVLALVAFVAGGAFAPASAADEKSYVSTTIRGKLTDPDSGRPMGGARLRFTPTDPSLSTVEAETNLRGEFEVAGLGYGTYAVEIYTAAGETIRGINALPVTDDESVEVILKLSDRIRSDTGLTNEADRFMAVVEREPRKWNRFWKQFGIFMGIAAATGAAAF